MRSKEFIHTVREFFSHTIIAIPPPIILPARTLITVPPPPWYDVQSPPLIQRSNLAQSRSQTILPSMVHHHTYIKTVFYFLLFQRVPWNSTLFSIRNFISDFSPDFIFFFVWPMAGGEVLSQLVKEPWATVQHFSHELDQYIYNNSGMLKIPSAVYLKRFFVVEVWISIYEGKKSVLF